MPAHDGTLLKRFEMLKSSKKVKQPTLREIKIKAGVVKRTGQELVMYQKESKTQQQRIDNLISSNADIHDIRKQVGQVKLTIE